MDIATANNTVAIVMANPIAKEMAEEFVDRATIFCLKEIKHISEGKPGLDSLEWSWGRK